MKTLNIVGAGRVGSTLARLWTARGVFDVQDVVNRSSQSTERACRFIGAGNPCQSLAAMRSSQVWLVGVCDSGIEIAASDIASAGIIGEGAVAFHCSGALSASVLSPLAKTGALTASLHPVKSFIAPLETYDDFAGTWCALEGHATAVALLRRALSDISAQAFEVEASHKLLYHAASVFACNYLVALMEVAVQSLAASGVEETTALEVMEPLVRGTLENLFERGTVESLTGPIARGDHRLVSRQLNAVSEWDDDHARLYRDLGKVALDLTRAKGRVGEPDLRALEKLLSR